jgi:hypothetical protein
MALDAPPMTARASCAEADQASTAVTAHTAKHFLNMLPPPFNKRFVRRL